MSLLIRPNSRTLPLLRASYLISENDRTANDSALHEYDASL